MPLQKPNQQKSTVQWCSVPSNRTDIPQPQLDTWVRLLEPESFNPFCHDEALLLCQISNWEWIAWIPDCGEAVINIDQFCVEYPTT